MTFTDEFRRAVIACMAIEQVTAYRLSLDLNISESFLGRFLNGERGLSFESIDKLARQFNLHIVRGRI